MARIVKVACFPHCDSSLMAGRTVSRSGFEGSHSTGHGERRSE